MSDAANKEPSVRSGEPATDTFATPEFHEALNAAEVLLGYAAGNGLMPANMPTNMVEDIVLARQAWQNHRVTAPVAIGFWIVTPNLSKLTKPITAASLRACEAALLRGEKVRAALLVLVIIVFSVFLFMNNTTANETADLIEQQNVAALKLWANLQILRSSAAEQTPNSSHTASRLENLSGTAFVNRAFEDAVEFSARASGFCSLPANCISGSIHCGRTSTSGR